jgi:hypothetical protein
MWGYALGMVDVIFADVAQVGSDVAAHVGHARVCAAYPLYLGLMMIA